MNTLLAGKDLKIVAVCSQDQETVNRTITDWTLSSFTAGFGNPSNSISAFLRPILLPNLEVGRHPANRLPNGMVQPSLLIVRGDTVLFRWATQSKIKNGTHTHTHTRMHLHAHTCAHKRAHASTGFGASSRPVLADVWADVEWRLRELEAGRPVQETEYDHVRKQTCCICCSPS